MSLAGCQINPIDVNSHLQNSLEILQIQLTKSNPKITKGVNVPCLVPIRVKLVCTFSFLFLPTLSHLPIKWSWSEFKTDGSAWPPFRILMEQSFLRLQKLCHLCYKVQRYLTTFISYFKTKEHKQEVQCFQKGARMLVLSFVALLRIFKQILMSYCKFIMPKALKWGMVCLCILIFQ